MALSVERNLNGPIWPIGLVVVAASGTPVNIMSVADSANLFNPATQTPGTAGASEYAARCQQIIFQACKSINPFVDNAGALYLLVPKAGSGTGNKTDSGCMVKVIQPGETFFLSSAPLNRNVFTPYGFLLDADNSADGAIISLVIQ